MSKKWQFFGKFDIFTYILMSSCQYWCSFVKMITVHCYPVFRQFAVILAFFPITLFIYGAFGGFWLFLAILCVFSWIRYNFDVFDNFPVLSVGFVFFLSIWPQFCHYGLFRCFSVILERFHLFFGVFWRFWSFPKAELVFGTWSWP